MKATYRVKDSNNNTVGFILDNGSFHTENDTKNNINLVTNLKLISNGVIRCDNELPIVSCKSIMKEQYKKLVKLNPFNREVQEKILEWKKHPTHKVLQLEGSRQIGKTTELLKFGYKNYEYVIYVNIANDIYNFIGEVIDSGTYTLTMEGYCRKANLPHYVNNKKTLLIIDEIQVSSNVYNSIREINSKLDCDLIVTGSYFGATLTKEFFQPMGTIEILKMFPLSFREFCRVFKCQKLLDNIDIYGGSDDLEYKKLYTIYNLYKTIGGYPSVISEYIRTKDVKSCGAVIETLLDIFEKESRNYFKESKETLVFSSVYTHAIHEMCSEKRGTGSRIVERVTNIVKDSQKMIVSRDEVSRALQWLIYSNVIGECDLCVNGDVDQVLVARRLYFMDCGIASYIARQTRIDDGTINGFLTENFAYTELHRIYALSIKYRKVKRRKPSFSTINNYELDFMILGDDNTVYGIEVKTDTGDPKSLKVFLEKKLIDKAIVAKNTKGGHGEKFDTIPIWAIAERFPYK